MEYPITDYNLKELFWEYDCKNLYVTKHKSFIIGRVLEIGRVEHLKTLWQLYGKRVILGEIVSNPYIKASTQKFWQIVYRV